MLARLGANTDGVKGQDDRGDEPKVDRRAVPVILTSEVYEQKASALGGIESVRANGAQETNFAMKESSAGQPYFVLKAANQQVIGQSEMYSSEAAAKNGIESVRKAAE